MFQPGLVTFHSRILHLRPSFKIIAVGSARQILSQLIPIRRNSLRFNGFTKFNDLTKSKSLTTHNNSNNSNNQHHNKDSTAATSRLCTVPNFLSLSRIALSPVLAYLVLTDHSWYASMGLIFVGLSDSLDGWLARRYKQESALGSLLDPIGDKVLALSLGLSLFITGKIPAWLLILVVGRDLLLSGIALITRYQLLRKNQISITPKTFFNPRILIPTVKPEGLSKANTFLQIVMFWTALALPEYSELNTVLQTALAFSTIGSGTSYLYNWRKYQRF